MTIAERLADIHRRVSLGDAAVLEALSMMEVRLFTHDGMRAADPAALAAQLVAAVLRRNLRESTLRTCLAVVVGQENVEAVMRREVRL